jgi:hypothetical protein
VEIYLAQHDVEPVTIEKLRWLLAKAVAAFGERPVGELRSEESAAWRIALSPGYRFDATQALRQVLARAVVWGMIDANPAKLGVDNPSPRRREQGKTLSPLADSNRRPPLYEGGPGVKRRSWVRWLLLCVAGRERRSPLYGAVAVRRSVGWGCSGSAIP